MNVKAFLAGKRGVCPQCSSGLDIPFESQIGKETSANGAGLAADSGDDAWEVTLPAPGSSGSPSVPVAPLMNAPLASSPHSGPSPTPAAVPVRPASRPATGTPLAGSEPALGPTGYPDASRTVPMQPARPSGQGTPLPTATPLHGATPLHPAVPMQPLVPVQPAGPVMAPLVTPVAPLDPIDESPQAIWYVRPPSGGQYGPARGEIMRKWLGEGRVSPDSLVWREGWSDWRTAAEAFPSLGALVTPPMPAPVAPAAYIASGTPGYVAGATRAKRRNSTTMAITVVTLLGLLCMALFGTLIAVLLR